MELKETEKRLLEAVSKIIEEEGFTQIGINRIAKKAQCDKVLIYRYFGGLDGLLAAWAKQYDFYSFAYSEFAGQIAQVTTANLKDIIDFSLFLLVLLLFIPYMNILKRLTLFSSLC